jgi:hypothetical protein
MMTTPPRSDSKGGVRRRRRHVGEPPPPHPRPLSNAASQSMPAPSRKADSFDVAGTLEPPHRPPRRRHRGGDGGDARRREGVGGRAGRSTAGIVVVAGRPALGRSGWRPVLARGGWGGGWAATTTIPAVGRPPKHPTGGRVDRPGRPPSPPTHPPPPPTLPATLIPVRGTMPKSREGDPRGGAGVRVERWGRVREVRRCRFGVSPT